MELTPELWLVKMLLGGIDSSYDTQDVCVPFFSFFLFGLLTPCDMWGGFLRRSKFFSLMSPFFGRWGYYTLIISFNLTSTLVRLRF